MATREYQLHRPCSNAPGNIGVAQSDNSSDSRILWLSDRALAEIGLLFGMFFGLVGIAGVGVPMIWPDEKLLGYGLVAFGAIGIIILLALVAIRIALQKGVRLGMILMILGTILMAIGWTVGMIGAFMMDAPRIEEDSVPRPLANLTTAQLREQTLSFAHAIRVFEDAFETEEFRLTASHLAKIRTLPESDKTAEFNAETLRMVERRNSFSVEFLNRYRGEALILRDELKWRLKELPQPTDPRTRDLMREGHVIFDGPPFAGVRPISAGATLLEYWARQLH